MKLLPLLAIAALAIADQQAPRFTTSRAEVRLLVSATNDRGIVQGLSAGDFTVADNGKKQTIRVTELKDSPLDLVVLAQPIESITMTSKEQSAAISAGITAVLQNLRPTDHVGAIIASAPPRRLRRVELGLLPLTRADFEQGQYAAPWDAIVPAIAELPDTERPRAVLALTTGVDFRSTLTQEHVAASVARLGPSLYFLSAPLVIQSEVRSGGMDREFDASISGQSFPASIQAIARKSGGLIVNLDRAAPAAIVSSLFTVLRSQYVVSYDAPVDKGHHSISVKVNQRGVSVRTREGYEQN